jgi:alkylation response protein AidB-like acyl-CoA dehydrogenase
VNVQLKANPVDEKFRKEIRSFLKLRWHRDEGTYDLNERSREAFAKAAQILKGTGWLAPAWPPEWGGAGLLPPQRYILEEELIAAGFPPKDRIALDLVGPVIITFGTLAQKRRYLPHILDGAEIWCQGFSEPESGSDVNSARTTAILDGSDYIVEGSKLWTTNAHFADMMFALVRLKTRGRLDTGLTFLLINMRDANVEVRPIITIDKKHRLNEVHLNRVRVPVSNVVGEPGRGWYNARFLLANERVLLSQAPRNRYRLAKLKRFLALRSHAGGYPPEDPIFMRKLAQVEIDLLALDFAVLRVLHSSGNDPIMHGLTCAVKLAGSLLRQRISELTFEALGDRRLVTASNNETAGDLVSPPPPALEGNPSATDDFLFDLSATIAGGTSEIQRNLIAAIALEL